MTVIYTVNLKPQVRCWVHWKHIKHILYFGAGFHWTKCNSQSRRSGSAGQVLYRTGQQLQLFSNGTLW